ncbi:MAG: hypothetical protein WBV94_21575, partial [Blastocatellia bacterium]
RSRNRVYRSGTGSDQQRSQAVSIASYLENPYLEEDYKRRLEAEMARREQFKSHERRAGLRFQSLDEWLDYSSEIVTLCNSSHTRAF